MKKISCLYEINTPSWLQELSAKYHREIKLANIPEAEIFNFEKSGFDAVRLMNVWLVDYEIDPLIGNKENLLDLKKRLNQHRLKLILDFVPNHLALDHHWVKTHPEFFVNGTKEDLNENPELFFSSNGKAILAYGKNPYFPPCKNAAQLNYFNPGTRQAIRHVLLKIAAWCDGVRCEMAMLILKRIQQQIWGTTVFSQGKFKEPENEFWQEAIPVINQAYPDFIFIAEVDWGLENEVLSAGFDYVYDKAFYDALKEINIPKVKSIFSPAYTLKDKGLRFIEEHDLGKEKSKAAGLILGLTAGPQIHLGSYYQQLLSNLKTLGLPNNQWTVLEPVCAWQGNNSHNNFIVLSLFDKYFYLAVINYAAESSQCYLSLNPGDIQTEKVVFHDLLNPVEYIRTKTEITSPGLYLDLPAFGFHLFKISGQSS